MYGLAYAQGLFKHWSPRYRGTIDLHSTTGPLARAAVKASQIESNRDWLGAPFALVLLVVVASSHLEHSS